MMVSVLQNLARAGHCAHDHPLSQRPIFLDCGREVLCLTCALDALLGTFGRLMPSDAHVSNPNGAIGHCADFQLETEY